MWVNIEITPEEIEELKNIDWIEVWSSKYNDCTEPVYNMIQTVITAHDSERSN